MESYLVRNPKDAFFAWHGSYLTGKGLIINLAHFRMKPALFQYAGTKDKIYPYSAGKGLIINLAHFRMKPALFQYAGTKDRRARTTQEVTAYRYN